MRDLFIRHYSIEGDSRSNRRHFRGIYTKDVGGFYYESLSDRMAKTTYRRKVILLHRKR